MSDITLLLDAARGGDRAAADRAYALLYDELRRLAHGRLRRENHFTLLDTTALVHESWLRLRAGPAADFPDRHHFLAYASHVMRSVVVDLVRARGAQRRGGGEPTLTLSTTLLHGVAGTGGPDDEVLRVHEALQALADAEPRLASVVEMRYFGGLTEPEIAAALGVTERTVQRDWHKARLFLARALRS